MHVLFQEVGRHQLGLINIWIPVWQRLNMPALALTIASLIAVFVLRTKMIPLLLLSSSVGMCWYLLEATKAVGN